ncbi:MAG: SDR family oxidoreductase [Magnetococcus sp. YQC-5]
MKGVWRGFKIAVGLVLGFPFLVILLPLWVVYRWNEQRSGREVPLPPWHAIMPAPVEKSENKTALLREQDFDPGSGVTPSGVALVTGGGRRLGAVICRELARQGFRVGVVYHRNRDAAENLVEEIVQAGGRACALALDLSNPVQMDHFLREAESLLGGVPELLVNNAALFYPTMVDEPSWETMSEMMRVNLQGPLWLSLRIAQRMSEHGGLIINIGDIWGERPLKGYAAYSVAKAGLLMATLALARELGPRVRVNAIAPGAVLPPEETTDSKKDAYRQLLARTPLAQHADPEAVVLAVRYLLSAQFVTGEILHVDGGRRLV